EDDAVGEDHDRVGAAGDGGVGRIDGEGAADENSGSQGSAERHLAWMARGEQAHGLHPVLSLTRPRGPCAGRVCGTYSATIRETMAPSSTRGDHSKRVGPVRLSGIPHVEGRG